ncbi:MAG TPA: class I SAM-dependent methyltransferase [Acidimicrobiales bacterium]|nr:class I SAM-dependent methyltransferase [Acidimicrobiales bacterium]
METAYTPPVVAAQFHFDPDTYLEMVRAEVPAYDHLQALIAEATTAVRAATILDLGSGTGATLQAVVALHAGAQVVGIDASPQMLAHAAAILPDAEFRVARLEDALPSGPFDLVTSALAVHHLDGPGKADLFGRVAEVLAPGGLFVLGDIVVPEDPAEIVTPIDGDYDRPSTLAEHVEWLAAAGLDPHVVWSDRDLAVVTGQGK